MEVPEMVLITSFDPPIHVLVTCSPGAYTLTHLPKFENELLFSPTLTAPTERTSVPNDEPAGEELQASWFSFPAATEKWTPAAEACLTASSRVVERVADPRDMEATEPRKSGEFLRLSWLVMTKSMPLRISEDEPEPLERTLTAMILAAFARPKVVEPAVPAQWVPWPCSSVFWPSKVKPKVARPSKSM